MSNTRFEKKFKILLLQYPEFSPIRAGSIPQGTKIDTNWYLAAEAWIFWDECGINLLHTCLRALPDLAVFTIRVIFLEGFIKAEIIS